MSKLGWCICIFFVSLARLAYGEGVPVVLQLKWDHEFQFAGFYAALEKGYYAEAGIDVDIRSRVNPDGSLKDVFEELHSGRADFALSGPDLLIASEQVGEIKILATLMQESPMVFVARPGEFASPAQFTGRHIANAEPHWGPVETHALLSAVGASDVPTIIEGLAPELSFLIDKKVDLVLTYAPSAYWQAMEMDQEFDYFSAAEYGVHLYGDTLIGGERFIEDNPEITRKFVEASLKGWEYAMSHPEEISQLIADKYQRVFDWYQDFAAYNRFEAENMRSLMLYPTVEIGHTSHERWEKTMEYFYEAGFIEKTINTDALIFDVSQPPPGISPFNLKLLIGAISMLLFTGSISLLWVRVLRKTVREKTMALESLNAGLEAQVALRTEELTLAKEKAESASKAKDRLVANVSHELRTPMNAIIGFSDLAMKDGKVVDDRGYLDRINLAAKSLLSIINDLLDFSKIEADKLELEIITFCPEQLLAQIKEILAYSAEDKGLGYQFIIDENLPSIVKGDPGRIQQVLTNIIGNAIKFTQQGEVSVLCKVIRTDDDVCTVEFQVQDTGVGIPPEKIEKMFTAFSQADVSVTRMFGGTGLGLTISRYLVNLMGGTIFVTSEVGKGACFSVNLPLLLVAGEGPKDSSVSQPVAPQASKPVSDNVVPIKGSYNSDHDGYRPAEVSSGKHSDKSEIADADSTHSQEDVNRDGKWFGRSALLVEDNLFNTEVARGFLEYQGFAVDNAVRGDEAVDMIHARKEAKLPDYDMILMDIQMPGWDGFQTANQIHQRFPDWTVPIIAMTAHASAGYRELCLERDLTDYLSKPLDEVSLVEVLHRQVPLK